MNVRFYLSYDINITLSVKEIRICHYVRNIVMGVIMFPENL